MLRIIHIDDSPDDLEIFAYNIKRTRTDVQYTPVLDFEELLKKLESDDYDCLLTDFQMPCVDGLQLINELGNRNIKIPVIMVTGHGSERIAVEAFRAGAHDYFNKNDTIASYERIVNSARLAKRQEVERQLRQEAERALNEHEIMMSRMIQMMPLPMAVTHADGRQLDINKKFIATYGYDLEELQTLDHWWPLAYPDEEYRHKIMAEFAEKFENAVDGFIEKINANITCKDGSVLNVDVYSNQVEDIFFHVHIVLGQNH